MDLLINTSSINAINYIVSEEDTSRETMVLLFTMHFLSGTEDSKQSPTIFEQRLNWTKLTERHQDHDVFCRHIRMSVASFDKLLGFLRDDISVNEEMAMQEAPTRTYFTFVEFPKLHSIVLYGKQSTVSALASNHSSKFPSQKQGKCVCRWQVDLKV
jgi:hypothetical protein